jgi:hypothetical protein
MLNLGTAFNIQSTADILNAAIPNTKSGELVSPDLLNNEQNFSQIEIKDINLPIEKVNIYQLDSLVRRAPALQATRDAIF